MSTVDKVTPTFCTPSDSAIFAQNLTFTYDGKSQFAKKALCDVNLDVKRGEFVAIVGHTGSGKSTFLQHLNALVRVQQGKLCVLGNNLHDKKPNLKGLRSQVGMVFQYPEYQLFADTVLQDVCFGLKNFGVAPEEQLQMAQDALTLVGLDFDKVKDKSPFDLSGGEKRRVALAGVLAMKPQLLVLDEPTAGLDPRGKNEILSLVDKLNAKQGVTVVMVSHDMNEVYEHAKRVIVFSQGKVVYDLPPRKLFRLQEQLHSINLQLPQMAQFANELEKYGVVLPDDCVTVRQVYDAILAKKGGVNA